MKTTLWPRRLAAALLLLLSAAGCASRKDGPPAPAPQPDFSALDRLLTDSLASVAGINSGLALLVYRNDTLIYEKSLTRGGAPFTPDRAVAIASASKWLSAIAIARAEEQGLIDWDDRVDAHLPQFTGTKGAVTLRQCFALTSGWGQGPWHTRTDLTLDQCLDSIAAHEALVYTPGTGFFYSGTSMQVAGGAAAAAAGKSWGAFFAEQVAQPLGLTQTDYFGLGITANPQIAGGARSTAREYAAVLRMLARGGLTPSGQRLLSPARIGELMRDQTGGVPILYTPYENYEALNPALVATRYGLGCWLEDRAADGAGWRNSSQGAFGFSPYLDRRRGIVAVLAVQSLLRKVMPTYLRAQAIITAEVDRAYGPPR